MKPRTVSSSLADDGTSSFNKETVIREPPAPVDPTLSTSLGTVAGVPLVENARVLVLEPSPEWKPSYRFELLQEWDGSVLTIDGDRILVRLIDKTNPEPRVNAEDISELSFDELTEEDRERVRPGAVFSWYIGYLMVGGTRQRTSQVRFRRLPGVYKRDLSEAARLADEIRRDLNWD